MARGLGDFRKKVRGQGIRRFHEHFLVAPVGDHVDEGADGLVRCFKGCHVGV